MISKIAIKKIIVSALLSVSAISLCCAADGVKVGAECVQEYFGAIKGKRLAVVANQTSVVNMGFAARRMRARSSVRESM